MEKAIVICDNFKLIHIGHEWLLKAVDEMMKKDDIQRCYIFVGQEEGDILGQYEKENMLQKLINKNERYLIYHVESLKIFKEIKQINIDGFNVVKVLVEPEEHSFIKNALAGLPTIVVPFKHNIDENKIEEYIESGNYQEYCNVMPQTLWAEFQNLKELYARKKISENKEDFIMTKTKLNLNDLEKYIANALNQKIKSLNEEKTTIRTTKKELYSLIESIIMEKLTGHAFNEMHELKTDIFKNIQKITKHKWIMSISNIGKKQDGSYLIKMIGSGNTRLSIVWGDNIDGDFSFTTSTSLVAGDEFSTSLYSFMNIMVEKRIDIVKMLKEIETKIITDNGDDMLDDDADDLNDINNQIGGMSEPTIDDIDSNISIPEPTPETMSEPTPEPDMINNGDDEIEISLTNDDDSDIQNDIGDEEDDEKIPVV